MPEKENQAVNDFSHLSQYQMPKERRGGKRNRRRVRKREKETTLVGEREGKDFLFLLGPKGNPGATLGATGNPQAALVLALSSGGL